MAQLQLGDLTANAKVKKGKGAQAPVLAKEQQPTPVQMPVVQPPTQYPTQMMVPPQTVQTPVMYQETPVTGGQSQMTTPPAAVTPPTPQQFQPAPIVIYAQPPLAQQYPNSRGGNLYAPRGRGQPALRGRQTYPKPPGLPCYKCGQEGHCARECQPIAGPGWGPPHAQPMVLANHWTGPRAEY